MNSPRPRARPGLIVRQLDDELVVYDPTTHTAHCLNRTAAIVLDGSDGRTDVRVLAARLAAATNTKPDLELVHSTLDRLLEAGLLEDRPARPTLSRRRAMQQLGLGAAVAAPAVVSLVVPTPAEAAATCVPAASCTVGNFGTPCYVSSQAECVNKTCTGNPGECL